MKNISLNIDKVAGFASKETIAAYEPQVKACMETLENGTGKGNDFLGWLHLPSSITAEHLADLKATAQEMCIRDRDYALGYWVHDWKTPWIMGNMQGTFNTISLVKDSWSESNPNGKYPVYGWADFLGKRNYDRISDINCYRGDYLAFREISLSYSLPQSWIHKSGLSKVDVSVTAQNLGDITAAKNMATPEYGVSQNGV